MSDTKRIIIGSELNDDRKITLDELGTKITLPVSIYNSNGTIIDSFTVTGVDLDIRNLVFATDKVDVSGSTVSVGHNITGISNGRTVVTTAGTRVALATSTACKKVDITAETDNTGIIVVGGATVVAALATRQGVPLYAGDTYSLEIDDLADIYLDTTVSGDGVTYTVYL